MSKHRRKRGTGMMLELWRPPEEAGDPVGCLATTYTFAPAMFDEQCLARFLEIESEPDREDLPFLLERESKLGGIYAGVLVDQMYAGIEHSLRWDVLPVRVPGGKQHAKLSLLVWSRHVRIIAASANLTEQGYRTNYEVAAAVDANPSAHDGDAVMEAVGFLRRLLQMVPGGLRRPEVERAGHFLDRVEHQTRDWIRVERRGTARQHFAFTAPAVAGGPPEVSSLDSALEFCRRRGGSPRSARIASPFFDLDQDGAPSQVMSTLCKSLARGGQRHVQVCVPALRDAEASLPRLAAPKSILLTPARYATSVEVAMLPALDPDQNLRAWHAKLLGLEGDGYTALMVGSSNFTSAGMGVGGRRNIEANLITILDHVAHSRDPGRLAAVWPDTQAVVNPEQAEWIGSQEEPDEPKDRLLPAGFLAAIYQAGAPRTIALLLDAAGLPEAWSVSTCGAEPVTLQSAETWLAQGGPDTVKIPWPQAQPPEKLLVVWGEHRAFLPLNVEDIRSLPDPPELEDMSADDMLGILAASDPSAALRTWVKEKKGTGGVDSEEDSAIPVDLNPLRRYDLHTTFLHRVRGRARVFAQLRQNLERPAWSRQTVEWRLHGLVGIEPLSRRFVREFEGANGDANEALLTLCDFLIVLSEVNYQAKDGHLSKEEFSREFRPFLRGLVRDLNARIEPLMPGMAAEMTQFWGRVVARCTA